MARQPVPHSDLRKAGLAAALVVGLLLAAGLTVVVLVRKPAKGSGGTGGNAAAKPPERAVEPSPDIADKGLNTGVARVQFADRSDPSRAAGMIQWSKLEPVSQIEKRLTDPRGYVYLRDGGLIVVSSKSGRLNTTPKVEEPQSGRFEGGVTLELYPAGYEPASDKPTLTATTDTLDFDLPSASIAATGAFTVRSTRFDIAGRGMRMVANQVEEGIERFEVAHVDKVAIRPDAADPKPAATLAGGTKTARPPLKAPGPDRQRTYRAVVNGAVKLTQEGRVLSADRVEAWASLLNNRFPSGAVGRLGPEPAPGSVKPAAIPAATGNDRTITGTWAGQLVVLPVADGSEHAKPTEFADNAVALRLHAGTAPVRIDDEGAKAVMEAARVDVGATRRTLALSSTPNMPVRINTADAGALECAAAAVNLGTGDASLIGPGRLIPAAGVIAGSASTSPTGEGTILAFDKSLQLQFATAGNWIDPSLKSATIDGGFKATSGEAQVSADSARVFFGQPVSVANRRRTPIDNILLSGNALASVPAASRANLAGEVKPTSPATPAGRDTLRGDSMAVKFEADPQSGRERPASLVVTGNARANAGGAQPLTLNARTINAALGLEKLPADSPPGKVPRTVVLSAEALEDVRLSDSPEGAPPRAGDTTASCQRLTIDPADGVAVLYGAQAQGAALPVTVTRDGATMTGPKVTLTQRDGTVFVDGPGTVSKLTDEDAARDVPFSSAFASWRTSMLFDNKLGTATCTGNAGAVVTTADVEKNTLNAETVILKFTPAARGDGSSLPSAPGTPRELISAEAVGVLGINGAPPRPAVLEHRRFAPGGGDTPRLERLVYLEGHRVEANQQTRTLLVPVPGKLLVDDRTPDAAPAQPAESPLTSPIGGFASARGTSLFTWQESMSYSMTTGQGVMRKDVQLTHQPPQVADQPVPGQTTLDCDLLTARLRVQQGAGGAGITPSTQGTLESVEAKGHVLAKYDGKTVTASLIAFDAIARMITAAAGEGTGVNDDRLLVSYLDPARAAPIQARKITWNQNNGEVRVIEPAPASIGR